MAGVGCVDDMTARRGAARECSVAQEGLFLCSLTWPQSRGGEQQLQLLLRYRHASPPRTLPPAQDFKRTTSQLGGRQYWSVQLRPDASDSEWLRAKSAQVQSWLACRCWLLVRHGVVPAGLVMPCSEDTLEPSRTKQCWTPLCALPRTRNEPALARTLRKPRGIPSWRVQVPKLIGVASTSYTRL